MDGDRHRYHRSIIRTAFTKQPMQGYLEIMPAVIDSYFESWQGTEATLMYPAMKELTLRLAGKVFFGLDFQNGLQSINQAFVNVVQAATSLPIKLPFTKYGKGIRARKRLEAFFREMLPQKRANPGSDLFSIICLAKNEAGDQLTDEQVIDHLIFILMAAHDTTASSLTSICYRLGQHPDWQEQLREEAQSFDWEKTLTPQKLRKLPLMGLVIKEVLRMHPPLILLPRMATREREIGGYTIPQNAFVSLQLQHTHRNETLWSHPDQFDPERFATERREDKSCPYAYAPFGGGAHHCIGILFCGNADSPHSDRFAEAIPMDFARGL